MQKNIAVILILFIVALAIVGLAFLQYFGGAEEATEQDTEQPAEDTNSITYPATTPEDVVRMFYEWYLAEDHALPSTAFTENDLLTSRFKTQVSAIVSATEDLETDPFVCATELPAEFSLGGTQIFQRRSTVVVNENFGETEALSFITELVLRDNAWQIDNTQCFIKG